MAVSPERRTPTTDDRLGSEIVTGRLGQVAHVRRGASWGVAASLGVGIGLAYVAGQRLGEPARTDQVLSNPPSTAAQRVAVAMTDRGPWIGLWGNTGDRSIYDPSGARVALDLVPKTPQDMLVDGSESAFLITWTRESGWYVTRLYVE